MTATDRAAHRYALKNMAVIAAVGFCVGVLAVSLLQGGAVVTIRAHLAEAFDREFGLPKIDPPVNPYQPGLSVVDCSGVLTGNADIEINNHEAVWGLCAEELPDDQ